MPRWIDCLVCLALSAAATLAAACSYDWTLGPEAVGGSDGGSGDAAEEIGLNDGGSGDAAEEISSNCAILTQAMASKRVALQDCNPAIQWPLNACAVEYVDECGCTRKTQKPAAADDYQLLVQQATAEGCQLPPCGTCPNPDWEYTCQPDGDAGSCQPSL